MEYCLSSSLLSPLNTTTPAAPPSENRSPQQKGKKGHPHSFSPNTASHPHSITASPPNTAIPTLNTSLQPSYKVTPATATPITNFSPLPSILLSTSKRIKKTVNR